MAEEIKVSVVFATAGAKRNVKKFTGELKEMEGQTKKTSKNASGSFANMKSAAMRNLGKAGLIGIATTASGAFVLGVNRMIDKGKEYQSALADLEAITGITGDQLDELSENALDLSVKYGESANNIIEANKLVASQLAEKIDFGTDEGLQQLQEVSEQAVVLQKAAGVDLATSVRTLTTAINQFNLPASETERLINSIAAGSKFGAAEVADQAAAYKDAGTEFAAANRQFEELNASTQILAQNALIGSQAGTGLRNVVSILRSETEKLAEYGISNLNVESEDWATTLTKLQPLLDEAGALTKIFGRENQSVARILIQNADSVGEMAEKVTDSNVAQEQLNVQMQTFETAQARLTSAIDAQLIPAFQESNGVMVMALNTLAEWVVQTGYAISVINDFFDAHSKLRDEINQGDDALGKQLTALRNLRKELAEAAISGKHTKEEQQELAGAYDDVTESIRSQENELFGQTFQLKQQRNAIEESRKSMVGWASIEAKKRVEALNLQIAANEERLKLLTKELKAGTVSWEEYVEQVRQANQEMDEMVARPRVDFEVSEDGILDPGDVDIPDLELDGEPIDLYADAIKRLTGEVGHYLKVSSVLGDHSNDINFAMQKTAQAIDQLIADGYSPMSDEVQKLKEKYDELKRAQQAQNAFMQTMASEQIETLADIGNAIRDQVLDAIKARIAEAYAAQIASIFSTIPFPLNIAVAAGAGALVSAAFNQIPSFRTGVDDYEGGMAKVHKNEVITYLPKGSNVITNKNVEAMDRMNNQPFVPDVGNRGSVTVQPSDNRDILAAIQEQTERMERMERRVEFNISEFERKKAKWLMKENGLG